MNLRLVFLFFFMGLAAMARADDERDETTAAGPTAEQVEGRVADPSPELTPEQQELLHLRQELQRLVEDGKITDAEAKERWAAASEKLDPDGGAVDVVILPQPEPRPDPLEEELRALREYLAQQVEDGELTRDEAAALFEEAAASLSPGNEIPVLVGEGDPPPPIPTDAEAERLLEDFRRELAQALEAGSLSPDEAEQKLLDFMLSLGLVKKLDGGPLPGVRPGDPNRPSDDKRERIYTTLKVFDRSLGFLIDHGVLPPEQMKYQSLAFMEVLEDGADPSAGPLGDALSPAQAEIIYLARELAQGYEDGDTNLDLILEELLDAAHQLALVDPDLVRPQPDPARERLEQLRRELDRMVQAGELTREEAEKRWLDALQDMGLVDPDPNRPQPDPAEERFYRLRAELAAQIESGRLTLDEAREQLQRAAEELGLVDATGQIVLQAPPLVRPPLPPEYKPSPEEQAMLELLSELTQLVESGALTEEAAWERLSAAAEELGWVDDEESLEPGAGIAVDPIDSKEAPPPQEKRLLNLRGNLASRVRGEDLSNEEAWEEMRMALTSSQLGDETRDGDDSTAIEETSWGTLKAAASRGWQ